MDALTNRWGAVVSNGLCAVLTASALLVPLAGRAQAAPPTPPPNPLNLNVTGSNGVGRIKSPGVRCADGGNGQYRHQSIEAPLPVTVLKQPGAFRGSLVVHRDGDEPVGTPLPSGTKAFLLGTESHLTLTTQRGAVMLRLQSGSCAAPSLNYDGTTASGAGTWALDPVGTTGAYRQASGSGNFGLSAAVGPGADSPWSLHTTGTITVLQPELAVSVVGASWGSLGVDYVTRRVTVTYKVSNLGPGDSFGAKVKSTTSSTAGVTPLQNEPIPIGDMPAGTSKIFSVRYAFTLLAGPCQLIILGCKFNTTVAVDLPDALDVVSPQAKTMQVTAPNLPPPLSS